MMEIRKPEGYKSSRIVYDQKAILVITLDYTLFQAHVELGEFYQKFNIASETDKHIIIEEIK